MAASGSAIRVTSDPKIEIVAAAQTRTKAWLRQSGEANGLRTDGRSIDRRIRPVTPGTGTIVSAASRERPAVHSARSVRQNSRTTRPGRAPIRTITIRRSPTRTMFDTLSERLRKTLGSLTGRGRISEADVDAAMREVRLALLEADVNFKVVKDFVARVRERAIGHEVLESLSAGQQVVKIVNDELVALLSAGDRTFHLSGNPAVVAMVGLQGSGKTTSTRQARATRRQARSPAAARRRRPVPPGRRRPARDARQEPRHPGLPGAGRDAGRRHRRAAASRRPSARSATS